MEQNPVAKPLTFKEQWEIKKLMKRAKKKAKHQLQSQGYGRREASAKVNSAIDRIAKPERKAAG